MEFDVGISEKAGVLIVEPRGEIDAYTAPRFKEEMVRVMQEGKARLIVDLSKVSFMDSSGLGVLVSVLKRTRDLDGALRIVCSEERLLKIFRITGLTKVFDIDADLGDALAAAGVT